MLLAEPCRFAVWFRQTAIARGPGQNLAKFQVTEIAWEVKRLFSQLGGTTQTVNCCNLAVDIFKTLGKCRTNYAYHLYERDWKAGKPIHHHHGHMHTHTKNGIDVTLANELETTFVWVPPLVTEAGNPDNYLTGLESIGPKEINETFDELEKEKQASQWARDVDGAEVLEACSKLVWEPGSQTNLLHN